MGGADAPSATRPPTPESPCAPVAAAALLCLLAGAPRAVLRGRGREGRSSSRTARTCHGEKGDANTDLGAKYMAQDFTSPDFKEKFEPREGEEGHHEQREEDEDEGVEGHPLPQEGIDALAQYVMTFPAAKK